MTNLFSGYSSPMWIRKQPQRRTIKPRRRKVLSTNAIPHIDATIKKVFNGKYSSHCSQSHYRFTIDSNIFDTIDSKSDIQHHIRTQQLQELLTQMDTIQRQSIDQNLRKLEETAGFSDIYTQEYSGYFKDLKDYIYLNGEKYRPQDISPINILSFVTLRNENLAFLGWPYYILERLTILYAIFNFIGFIF